jgi:uroporphyrinogen-III synthase
MAQYTILSTKQLRPDLKEEMAQRSVEVIEQDFIAIQPILTKEKTEEVMQWVDNPSPLCAVFTSRHALASIEKHISLASRAAWRLPTQWKICCLDGATRDAVMDRLWQHQIAVTASTATELANGIVANGSFKEVVFFCSNRRRDELPNLLKENGITVREVVVYETVETPQIATGNLDAVLFFSPSAAKSFFSVNTLKKETACFAIGNTTAQALHQYTPNRVIVSEGTSQDLMVVSVLFYLQNIDLYK